MKSQARLFCHVLYQVYFPYVHAQKANPKEQEELGQKQAWVIRTGYLGLNPKHKRPNSRENQKA